MADHADHLTNRRGLAIDAPSHEISDFHLFSQDDNLVFSIAFNPTNRLRAGEELPWPDSLTLKVNVDLDATILRDNTQLNRVAGGRFANPSAIQEDIVFDVQVRNGTPKIKVSGDRDFRPKTVKQNIVNKFSGTRSETFIFGPNARSNRNLIVFEVKKDALLGDDADQTLSAWVDSVLEDGDTYVDSENKTRTVSGGPYFDSAGRALKDQDEGLRLQNALHPSEQVQAGFGYPDMLIFDTRRTNRFPNGRRLEDDILNYLSKFNNTTPPKSPPDNRDGVDNAFNAQTTFEPLQGFLVDADPNDFRYWNQFPYVGEAYNIPNNLENEQVHRFRDAVTGTYYLTSNALDIAAMQQEVNSIDEGIVFPATAGRGVAVHRLLNSDTGDHFWTISKKEVKRLERRGRHIYEGETFFVEDPASASLNSTTVHRLFDADSNRYVWTADNAELTNFLNEGWTYDRVAWTV
ncbi:MAG: hypothetical protein ACPHAS_07230 [Synechococcus sp.]